MVALRYTLILVLSIASLRVNAQYSFYNKPKFEKWFYLGGGHFFGDLGGAQKNGTTLGGSFDLANIRPAAGLGLRYNAKRWVAFRGGLGYAFFSQSDANAAAASQNSRNLSFQTDVVEASGVVELRVATFGLKTKKRKSYWEYYVFGGVGAFYYNPKARHESGLVQLRPLGTEGQGLKPGTTKYSPVAASFPIGGGLRLGTGFNSSFFVEMGYRITTTDYIDDVSANYYTYNDLLSNRGQVAVDMSYRGSDAEYPNGRTRGNPFNKDSFLIINLGFSTSLKGRRLTRFHGR